MCSMCLPASSDLYMLDLFTVLAHEFSERVCRNQSIEEILTSQPSDVNPEMELI